MARVVAIEPDVEKHKLALTNRPQGFGHVEFLNLGLDEHEKFLGYMQETDDYIEHHQADDAIETAINRGLFHLDVTGEFEFRTYADSFSEMKEFLNENWSDAVITDEVIASAMGLEKGHGEFKTVLREQVVIELLRPSRWIPS